MNRIWILPAAGLLALTPGAWAQSITGRVVDANGVPVPGVNIDVNNLLGGGDPIVNGDSTNAFGDFTTTITPAGVYEITFTAPKPPITTHLRLVLDNQVVTGVLDYGTLALSPGVSLGGRIVNTLGQPVGGVDLDVRNLTTGESVELSGDNSDAFGNFLMAVPPGPIELQLDPGNIPLVVYAPRALQLSSLVNVVLGDLTLEPGFLVSGLLRSQGLAVVGADLDAELSATGEDVYLKGDDSGSFGGFSVVIAAGTYDFSICPQPGERTVALEFPGVQVGGDLDVGTVVMEPGVLLSGNVLSCEGGPAEGVDVEIKRSTGAPVELCRDNTDINGNYTVVVPTGDLNVRFRHLTLGNAQHPSVSVTGDSVLSTTVSPTAADVRNGAGVNPLVLTNLTLPVLGTTWSATVDCAGHAPGFAVLTSRRFAFEGAPGGPRGQRLVAGTILAKLTRAHSGGVVQFDIPVPNDLQLCGLAAPVQAVITGGFVQRTNALDLVLGH